MARSFGDPSKVRKCSKSNLHWPIYNEFHYCNYVWKTLPSNHLTRPLLQQHPPQNCRTMPGQTFVPPISYDSHSQKWTKTIKGLLEKKNKAKEKHVRKLEKKKKKKKKKKKMIKKFVHKKIPNKRHKHNKDQVKGENGPTLFGLLFASVALYSNPSYHQC
jgi:hypothetical protein